MFQFRSRFKDQDIILRKWLIHLLVVVDTTLSRDPEVGHKMAMSMSKSSD